MAHLTDNPYINNSNIMMFLQKLADELYKRYNRTVGKVDILIVGGSAIALKYGYRSTVDIDADIKFGHSLVGSVNEVAKSLNIPKDWINQDFTKSMSYSRRLWENCIKVATLNNFMNIYVVSDLDQLCMKMVSGRYKDYNDIRMLAGIVAKSGVTYQDVNARLSHLYGNRVKVQTRVDLGVRGIFGITRTK